MLLNLYHRLPAPLRSLVASARGYHLRAWRYGADTERLAAEAEAWCRKNISQDEHGDADATCVKFVAQLGQAGFLEHCVSATPDVGSIALLREVSAREPSGPRAREDRETIDEARRLLEKAR